MGVDPAPDWVGVVADGAVADGGVADGALSESVDVSSHISTGSESSDAPYRGRSWAMCLFQTSPLGCTRTDTVLVPRRFITTAATHLGSSLRLGPQ